MTKLIVDGKEIDVPAEYTLLQACEAAGAEIPRFCYHERLSIAGNCRMCLVEVKGGPKPVASCAWGVRDCRPGPKGEPPEISTRSPMVKKAREGVMEFLLINHPLDCPICDQGGECDLQDQAMGYGVDTSRFAENKRAVEDKYLGALVKTSMNRCIQCTRCVRFSAEVCGAPEMGATGRGEDMEITTYLEQALTLGAAGQSRRHLPGGRADLETLRVRGAALGARQDPVDRRDGRRGLGDPGRYPRPRGDAGPAARQRGRERGVDFRQDPPHRRRPAHAAARPPLYPRERQAARGLVARSLRRDRRQGQPHRRQADRRHRRRSRRGRGDVRAEGICSPNAAPPISAVQGGDAFDPKAGRASYIFNPTIAGIDQADALLIIGSNPRKEAAVLNARIRKRWRSGQLKVGLIGAKADLTYTYDYLGAGTDSLKRARRRQGLVRRCTEGRKEPDRAGRRRCGQRAMTGRRFFRSPPSSRSISARSRTAGTALPSCTMPRRASARSISDLAPAPAA